ncbi:hypothetical protein [uncultured Paraburkholderia sp.]|uniref:hypothetical protein n=1 Tax=uncultured Paraburkholderia sp. TaxID=1822466 RepID=UPI00259155BC|nr:hypothetical protein [uncultured Paraburkholderia sp.]
MDLNLGISSDEARQLFFERVSSGSIAPDGVMSPLTRELAGRFGTESVDMTFGWACTPMDWVCPACRRGKPEIVRLNTNGHLMCRLVEHHDHMKDLVKDEFERQCKLQKTIVADEFAKRFATRASPMISAYDNAIICDDCNAADPKAKGAVGTRSVDFHAVLTHRGCGHFPGLIYVVSTRLSRYSMGLR